MTPRQNKLGRWGAIVGLIAAIFALFAALKRPTLDALDIATEQRVDSLKALHERDILRIEKKLDCALFTLPANCKQTLAPRE